jgi:hypothetical protein
VDSGTDGIGTPKPSGKKPKRTPRPTPKSADETDAASRATIRPRRRRSRPLSPTEPRADPGIVVAEPHEANRIVVDQLVEAFLFASEFEADHRQIRLGGQAVIATPSVGVPLRACGVRRVLPITPGVGDPNPDKPVMTIARADSCSGIFCCDLDHSPEI